MTLNKSLKPQNFINFGRINKTYINLINQIPRFHSWGDGLCSISTRKSKIFADYTKLKISKYLDNLIYIQKSSDFLLNIWIPGPYLQPTVSNLAWLAFARPTNHAVQSHRRWDMLCSEVTVFPSVYVSFTTERLIYTCPFGLG